MGMMAGGQERDLTEVIDGARIGRYHLLVFVLCALIAMLDGFDTQSLAFVVPVLVDEWGLPASAFGPVFGAGLFGLMIGQLVLGPLADLFGRRTIILASTVIIGVFCLATAFANDLGTLLVLRFLTGIGLGGAIPNIIAMTGEFAPKRMRAAMITTVFAGFPIGAVLGGMISTRIIPAFGWQSVFYLGGLAPILLLVVLWLWLPESPRHAMLKGKPQARVHAVMRRLAPDAVDDGCRYVLREERLTGTPIRNLFTEGRGLRTMLVWLTFFMSLLVIYFLMSWLPTVLKQSGLGFEMAIYGSVFLNAGGAFGGILWGRLIDRYNPAAVLATAYAIGGLSVLGIGFAGGLLGHPALLMLIVILAGATTIGAQTGMSAFASSLYPTTMRSTALGTGLAFGRIGSICGPVLGGFLMAEGWGTRSLFAAVAVPAVIAAGIIVLIGCAGRRDGRRQGRVASSAS